MFGLRLKWLGCACFEMDFDGLHIVNDPWITPNQKTELTWEDVEKCDYITLTHSHSDHIVDIPALMEKRRNLRERSHSVLFIRNLTCFLVLLYQILQKRGR